MIAFDTINVKPTSVVHNVALDLFNDIDHDVRLSVVAAYTPTRRETLISQKTALARAATCPSTSASHKAKARIRVGGNVEAHHHHLGCAVRRELEQVGTRASEREMRGIASHIDLERRSDRTKPSKGESRRPTREREQLGSVLGRHALHRSPEPLLDLCGVAVETEVAVLAPLGDVELSGQARNYEFELDGREPAPLQQRARDDVVKPRDKKCKLGATVANQVMLDELLHVPA